MSRAKVGVWPWESKPMRKIFALAHTQSSMNKIVRACLKNGWARRPACSGRRLADRKGVTPHRKGLLALATCCVRNRSETISLRLPPRQISFLRPDIGNAQQRFPTGVGTTCGSSKRWKVARQRNPAERRSHLYFPFICAMALTTASSSNAADSSRYTRYAPAVR